MNFWQVILLMSVLASGFVVWPVFWRARLERIEREQSLKAQELTELNMHSDDTAVLNRDALDRDALDTEVKYKKITPNNKALQTYSELTKKWAAKGFKSRFFLVCIAILIPAVSYLYYTQHGQAKDWLIHDLNTKASTLTSEEKKELYSRLQQRTKQTPDNTRAWYLYANIAQANKNIGEAKEAYSRVLALQPDSPNVMASLTQVLLYESDQVVTPEIKTLTMSALKLDPNNSDALGVAGLAAYQNEEYEQAISFWEKALATFRPNSPSAQTIEQALVRAEMGLKSKGKKRKKKTPNKPSTKTKPIKLTTIIDEGSSKEIKQKQEKPTQAIEIKVKISLDEKVRTTKESVVFVYARAWKGPKMPLAIKRLTVSQLPTDITLDNTMAMAPGLDLSSFEAIELVARISKSGNALPEKGDWQVTSGKIQIKENNEPINLIIAKQLK